MKLLSLLTAAMRAFLSYQRVSGLMLALLLNSLSLAAQVSSGAEQPAGLGIIRGRVVNDAGQPLAGAIVAVGRLDSIRAEQSTITDLEGKFEFTSLQPLTYRLAASLPAYTPPVRTAEEVESGYRVGDTVTLVLVKGGVITGTVTNQAGEPIVGVWVRARAVGELDRLPWLYRLKPFGRPTDDRGVYRIYGLPEGKYVVAAGGAGDPSYNPDPFETDLPTYAPASTRDTADEISLRNGEEISNVDIRYRDEPGRVISGRVIGPASVETRLGVMLNLAQDRGTIPMSTSPASGNNGFIFRGLTDGDYELRGAGVQQNGEFMWSALKRIRVNGADVSGIELTVQPLSSVSGKVILQAANATACSDKQRPLFSETVVSALSKTRDSIPVFWPVSVPNSVDAEGNLTLKNLFPGQYHFSTQFSGAQWYLDSITLPAPAPSAKPAKPLDAARSWTTLKSGERLSGLAITLTQGAASMRGQVAAREGEKLADALTVYLVPAEREKADDPLRFFMAAVGADGKVAVNNIAPGRYWILTKSDGPSPRNLRLPDQTELRSQLRRDAEAAKTEIEFKPCQNVVDFRL